MSPFDLPDRLLRQLQDYSRRWQPESQDLVSRGRRVTRRGDGLAPRGSAAQDARLRGNLIGETRIPRSRQLNKINRYILPERDPETGEDYNVARRMYDRYLLHRAFPDRVPPPPADYRPPTDLE